MRHHTLVCRLGVHDRTPVATRGGSHVTEISFIEGNQRLSFGLGQAIGRLRAYGLSPLESAVDLAVLAATVTAADTRISRELDAQDGWTREIDLYVPVADPASGPARRHWYARR